MNRYNLYGDFAATISKVTSEKMTLDQCKALDIPIYYSECEHGHKLKWVDGNNCMDCTTVTRRHNAQRVAIKKRLDELEARRELEALEGACTYSSTPT